MKKNIWFMGGLSSQRDIISGVKNTSELHGNAIQVFASHHQHRYEILEKRMLLLSNRRILTPKWRLSAIS